jgi:Uma2 family endonuclease
VNATYDRARDIDEKAAAWLAAGTSVVWIIDPPTRTIRVARADGSSAALTIDDDVEEPSLLPGFRAAAADVFDLP